MTITAPGTAGVWMAVPNDLGGATTKSIMRWAQPAVRDVLPRRLFGPHPKQMFLQTLLGSVAQLCAPDERYFVHRAELPDEVLLVRVRWSDAPSRLDDQLRAFVETSASSDVTVGTAVPSNITRGIDGLRAPLERAGEAVGWVAAFPVGDLAVQLRFDVPPEFVDDLQDDVVALARALRAA